MSTEQDDARNWAEWGNPANWHGGVLGLYHAPRDSRTFVPKRSAGLGWTLNLARPLGRTIAIALLTIAFAGLVLGVREGRRG